MIEMGKKYRTRDGRKVRILCVDRLARQPVLGLISNGIYEERCSWNKDGTYHCSGSYSSDLDLIEISPYEDWPIDAPVWVRKRIDPLWYPRHYAGTSEDGRPVIFSGGCTSFSQDGKFACDEARLASEFSPPSEECGE